MLPIALLTVVLLELVKTVTPPLQTWAKFLAASGIVLGLSWYHGLTQLEAGAAWGLAHVIHAGVRLLLAVSDYYRVESVVRARAPRQR